MFVTVKLHIVLRNTVGVECVLNYSIPLGLLDLGEFNLLQIFNP